MRCNSSVTSYRTIDLSFETYNCGEDVGDDDDGGGEEILNFFCFCSSCNLLMF